MKKLFNKSKILYYILGLISGVIILSSLFFMTQYRYVRVNYSLSSTGEVEYLESNSVNSSDQSKLFIFINDLANRSYEKKGSTEAQSVIDNNDTFSTVLTKDSEDNYKYLSYEVIDNGWVKQNKYVYKTEIFEMVRDFRVKADNINNMILIFGIISLVMFAGLLIISNHDRKIYYKENLIGGILLPLVNVVLMVVLIINCLGLVSDISDPTKNAIYNIFSVSQNSTVAENIGVAVTDATNTSQINNIISNFNVTPSTAIVYMIGFALVAAYNVFLIIFAVLKYNDTAKERKEVLDRARLVGEKS
jgi:hypothetical protein